MTKADTKELLSQFALANPVDGAVASTIGEGLINESYLIEFADGARKVLQRINGTIFPDPDALMQNFCRVTNHIRSKGAVTLRHTPTSGGEAYYRDAGGAAWRLLNHLEGTAPLAVSASEAQMESAAKAFGVFSRLLADLPQPRLHEVIPGFHNTRRRFDDFLAAAKDASAERKQRASREIDAILARQEWCTLISDAVGSGDVPERVAHNDAKLDNVLLRMDNQSATCVIDLDTVMPGSILHDFGDLVRSAAATAVEDEEDLSRIGVSVPRLNALTQGFLAGCGDILTARERELLPLAGAAMTYEQAVRFLTDFLCGNPYYKTSKPDHNLHRARNQLHLLGQLEQL